MRNYLMITGMAILSLFYACSKSNSVNPNNPGNNPPVTVDTAVTISGFSPDSASAGQQVTITGNNFGTSVSNVNLQIGAVSFSPLSVSNASIIFGVPANIGSGKILVNVKNHLQVSTGAVFNFIPASAVKTLAITDFSPKTGRPGALITITGTGFGTDPSLVRVVIGSTLPLQPVSVTPTVITVNTNDETPTGRINVIVNGKTVTSAVDFTALPPALTVVGISPGNGSQYQFGNYQLGHQMYISGDGFGTDTSKISISFGGTAPVHANYLATDGLAIGAIFPRYAKEGKVTVTVGGVSVTCNQSYTFSMSLRDYSPKTFHVGDTVKITGVAFTNTSDMSVEFNDYKVTRPISVTPTQMLVIVPYTAKSGYLTVSADVGTISDFTSDQFTLLP